MHKQKLFSYCALFFCSQLFVGCAFSGLPSANQSTSTTATTTTFTKVGTLPNATSVSHGAAGVFAISGGQIYRLNSSGTSWSLDNPPASAGSPPWKFLTRVGPTVFAANANVVASRDATLWNASPKYTGANITALEGGTNRVFALDDGKLAFAQSPSFGWTSLDSNSFFPKPIDLGVYGNEVYTSVISCSGVCSNIHKSSDSGATWVQIGSTGKIGPISVGAAGPFVGIQPPYGFGISKWDGSSWGGSVNGLFPNQGVNVIYAPGFQNRMLVGYNSGYRIAHSFDGGANWQQMNTGLPLSANVTKFDYDGGNCRLYAATSAGVYRTGYGPSGQMSTC